MAVFAPVFPLHGFQNVPELLNHSPMLPFPPMTTKSLALTVTGLLLFAGASKAQTAPMLLPLRCEANGVYIHNGVTSQTLETNFGSNMLGLPFTNTTTFDFYSPPLANAVNLTTSNKADGQVFLTNSDSTGSYNFSATARMQYYDYNPATGTNVLLVDTQPTNVKNVNDGATVAFALSKQTLLFNYTLPAGHLVHVAVIVNVTSGNAGGYGQLLYNGPQGTTSYADFPQNWTVGLTWPLSAGPMMPPQVLSLNVLGDPVAVVHCSGTPGATYLIQATTNLAVLSSWTTIGTNVAGTNGLFNFADLGSTNYRCRFYRASTP